MFEMMVDLETEDTKPSAVVLSIGAVVWETLFHPRTELLSYRIEERFLRVPSIDEQKAMNRTTNPSTLLWWREQNINAKAEAYNPVRQSCVQVLEQFREFATNYENPENMDPGINAFWASPATFDFPIWEDFAMTFNNYVPWTYRQKYDVRTVVREANLSAKGHKDDTLVGTPHTPVYDCEWQISLLTAARQKLNRRSNSMLGERVT